MQKLKELTKNKVFKTILNIIKIILVIFIITFVLVVYMQRFSNNKLSFFKYRMFTVVSGSMEPKYKVGDVLFAQEIAFDKYKIGDAISYVGKYGDVRGKIVTHQITDITKDSEGNYLFYAKGINNLIEDPVIGADQVYGKVVFKSVILSMVYKTVATSSLGLYLCIIVPFLAILSYEIVATLIDKEDKKRGIAKS